MKKGDILFGRKNSDAIHPIIYLRDRDKNFFIGAMLTRSNNYTDNIPMTEKHFKRENPKGVKYEFFFDDTHLVDAKLTKRDEWKPFKKVGELSVEGIKFVESRLNNKNSKFWEDYLRREREK